MAQYFAPFPRITYNVKALNKTLRVTDITKRFIISDFYRKNFISYYTYDVKEGERPDNVAYSFYGDSNLDWVILLPNLIIDPYYEWPRSQSEMESYIRSKYGSTEMAMKQIHHYEQITQKRKEIRNEDGELIILPEKTLIIDYETYISLGSSDKKQVNAYDYEIRTNDRKRNISIIDPSYVPSLVETHRNLYI